MRRQREAKGRQLTFCVSQIKKEVQMRKWFEVAGLLMLAGFLVGFLVRKFHDKWNNRMLSVFPDKRR